MQVRVPDPRSSGLAPRAGAREGLGLRRFPLAEHPGRQGHAPARKSPVSQSARSCDGGLLLASALASCPNHLLTLLEPTQPHRRFLVTARRAENSARALLGLAARDGT